MINYGYKKGGNEFEQRRDARENRSAIPHKGRNHGRFVGTIEKEQDRQNEYAAVLNAQGEYIGCYDPISDRTIEKDGIIFGKGDMTALPAVERFSRPPKPIISH